MKIDNSQEFFIENDDQYLHQEFYDDDSLKYILYITLNILTLGIYYLFIKWYPHLKLNFYKQIQNIEDAKYVVFRKENKDEFSINEIQRNKVDFHPYKEPEYYIYINHNNSLLIYNEEKTKWIQIELYFEKSLKKENIQTFEPLSKQKSLKLKKFYGENIIQMQKIPFIEVLFDALFTPINVYEFLLIFLNFIIEEYLFIFLLFFYITIQTLLSILVYYKKVNKINKLAEYEEQITVLRKLNGIETKLKINSKELVIGDIVKIESNQIFTCDIIITTGECLINEAVLTGESMPVNKSQKKKKILNQNTIFAGSTCLQVKSKEAYGVVIKTSWSTYKGNLVSKLIAQEDKPIKYDQDFLDFLQWLFILFVLLGIISTLITVRYNWEKFHIKNELLKFMEIVINAAPPSLFFCIVMMNVIISKRLEKQNIFCLMESKIPKAGRIKTVCFDKTGTLTENSIKIYGYCLSENQNFEDTYKDIKDIYVMEGNRQLLQLMSCCHSLNILNNEIVGDPMEVEMFKATNFRFMEKDYNIEGQNNQIVLPSRSFIKQYKFPDNYALEIIQQIPFTSERKRMSSIVYESSSGKNMIFTKGAAEIMKNYFIKEDLPQDYNEKLIQFSEEGQRVLAMGYKEIKNYKQQEEENYENDLKFLGFILFDNPVKDSSQKIINRLKQCNVDSRMITGDNIFTAIHVGIKVGLIEDEQQIWVGQYQEKEQQIQWTQFDNQQGLDDLKTVSKSSVSDDLQSRIKSKMIKGKTIDERQMDQVLLNIESQNKILCVDGNSFESIMNHFQGEDQFTDVLIKNIKIFARTNPDQKFQIIKTLQNFYQDQQFHVGFVGDGANDAQALHQADMGMSIGLCEASLASSFSTSKESIEPIIQILEEGKFFNENFLNVFKLSILMGCIEVVIILYMSLKGMMFNVLQMILLMLCYMPIFVTMSLTEPQKLNYLFPPAKYLNKKLIFQIFINLGFALFCITLLYFNLFYNELSKDINNITDDLSDQQKPYIQPFYFYTFLFVSNSLFSLGYNGGYPFKKPFYTNFYLCLMISANLIFVNILYFNNIFENFYLNKEITQIFGLPDLNGSFQMMTLFFIILCIIGNLSLANIVDLYFTKKQFQKNRQNLVQSSLSVKTK